MFLQKFSKPFSLPATFSFRKKHVLIFCILVSSFKFLKQFFSELHPTERIALPRFLIHTAHFRQLCFTQHPSIQSLNLVLKFDFMILILES